MTELPYLVKPLHGQPCNGCGYCCQQEVCELALLVDGSLTAPCSYLVYADGRTYCGLVQHAAPATALLFKKLLGIGRGCCSTDS